MPDWSALPGDLLRVISDGLSLVDRVRFAAVCVRWRQAVVAGRRHPPLRPQPPWLMSVPCSDAEPSTAADFFCLADGTWYRLDLPEPPIRHRLPVGSTGGWLVTTDEVSELLMLNPLTGVQVRLPSILTLPTVDAVRDANGSLTGYLFQVDPDHDPTFQPMSFEDTRHNLYSKVVLSNAPSSSEDWIAVLIYNPYRQLAFARAGDKAWTVLPDEDVDDVMYSGRHFYAVHSMTGATTSWDLNGPSPQPKHSWPSPSLPLPLPLHLWVHRYLVELGGDLLQVLTMAEPWEYCKNKEAAKTRTFEVFRFDTWEGNWVEVMNLGERALFLGLNTAMSLSTLEYPQLKRNCIYFAANYGILMLKHRMEEFSSMGHDIGVFSLKDRSIEHCCSYNNCRSWPPPIWIMPSFDVSKPKHLFGLKDMLDLVKFCKFSSIKKLVHELL